MTRDEQEMALWREAYNASRLIARTDREAEADMAVAAFRRRYPQQASPEVWCDEPPFEKDGKGYHCWVEDIDSPQAVYWSDLHSEWRFFEGVSDTRPLNRRRVYPIAKPEEPTS